MFQDCRAELSRIRVWHRNSICQTKQPNISNSDFPSKPGRRDQKAPLFPPFAGWVTNKWTVCMKIYPRNDKMLQTTRFGIGVQELDDFIARAIILISKSINRTQKDRKMQVLPWKVIFSSAYCCTSLQKVEKRIYHRWNCPKLCRMSVGNVLDRKRTNTKWKLFQGRASANSSPDPFAKNIKDHNPLLIFYPLAHLVHFQHA